MNATATTTVPALTPAPAGRELEPIVLVNGAIEPRLRVRAYEATAPLDRRHATLAIVPRSPASPASPASSAELERTLPPYWFDADITVLVALRLVDDQVRYAPLVRGRIDRQTHRRDRTRDEHHIDLVDRWSHMLDRTIDTVWRQTTGGVIHEKRRDAVLAVDDDANRSADTWSIAESDVHVLQSPGQPWTIATALQTLAAFAGFDIAIDLIPRQIRNAPLARPVDLSQPVAAALARILDPYGLLVQRDLSFEQGRVCQRCAIRPAGRGRPIHLRWADDDRPLGDVLRVDVQHEPPAAQQWIARGNGPVVESTFALVPGWDAALEGQPDSDYSRDNSSDWLRYANVYRYWALNEDGHFTPAPFARGAPFDLGAFFAQAPMSPRPLRFLHGLTVDDAGDRRPPLLEISTDGGATWATYPGTYWLDKRRAAVYLNDIELPSAFLVAAKTGDAAVRLTASLSSPHPHEVARWRGNPFAGTKPPRILSARHLFTPRRVAPHSIHYQAVQDGILRAVEIDPTHRMARWLLEQIELEKPSPTTRTGKVQLTLAGVNPLLRPGDRLFNSGGPGRDGAHRDEAIGHDGGTIVAVRCAWPDAEAGDAGPSTTVDLHF